MALFNKSQQQMVFDLLIAENPGLAGAVLGTNVEFVGTPTVVSGALTTAKLRGIRGAGFTGVRSFTYNRLDLGRLFANVTIPTFYQYTATQITDLLVKFNATYGLNLTASDVVNATWGTATSQTVRMNATGTGSYVYYGMTQTFTWQKGTQQLTDYYPDRSLSLLTLPDLMLKAFQIDFSDVQATLEGHDTTMAFSSASSTAQSIVDVLAMKTGLPVTLGATTTPGSGQYDLSGFTLNRTTPDVVQDSNPVYRKVAILTPPAVFGNQYTPIYLHYDKIPVFVKTKTTEVVSVTELDGLQPPTK